jgi:NAD(P)-dependent dehydrogenase (short-subunit alcohol dehydrogenase family)
MRVLITGAASGFGRALSTALRDRGERVAGIDLFDGNGIRAADVRDATQVATVVAQLVDEMDGLDVLVNNAGIGIPLPSSQAPDDDTLAVLDVNLLGAWRVTAAALPALIEARGRVINISSGLAFVNVPYAAAYCASKRGLAAYSDVLRMEHRGRIHVTTVYPGYVKTPIHRRGEEMGLSLDGAVPEESIDRVVATLVRACYARRPRRDLATSASTRAGLTFARHAPGIVDAIVGRRWRRLIAAGRLPEPHAPITARARSEV